MKKKYRVLLIAFAILAVLIVGVTEISPSLFGDVLVLCRIATRETVSAMPATECGVLLFFTLPLTVISYIPIALSTLGKIGNAFAITFIGLVSSVPLFFIKGGEKKNTLENVLLVLLFPITAFTLFALSNPITVFGMLPVKSDDFYVIMKAIICGVVYSGISALIVIKILKKIDEEDAQKLFPAVKAAILLVICYFIGSVTFVDLPELFEKINEYSKPLDIFISIFDFVTNAAPYALTGFVLTRCLSFADSYSAEDTDKISLQASEISRTCINSLYIMTAMAFINNLLPVVLSKFISNINVMVTFPILNIIFCVVILILSKLIVKNRELKDDNDLFV